MKILSCVLVIAACMLPLSLAGESPVVVELFTSEGCSSCPPADALLVKLSQMEGPGLPQVIVLGEHVDYWNGIGWKDRFSSREFTERQQDYAQHFGLSSPYTPQMVIDGQKQLVGNNASEVGHDIDAAAKVEKAAKITVARVNGSAYQVSVQSGAGNGKVFLAVTEDALSTDVKGGENGGRTLHHAGVVRELRSIGSLSNGQFEKKVDVPIQREWNPANLKLVVFLQQGESGPIVGATSLRMNQ
jgi:hypothetical protein